MDKSRNVFHLKGLNGVRAIAAFTVLVAHILQSAVEEYGFSMKENFRTSGFGVTIFFVLSGFLITYLLLLEKKQFNTINVKAFYIRRILRIWPLYYFYIGLAVLVIFLFTDYHLPGTIVFYLIMMANLRFVLNADIFLIGHYWSLGVEEQFYLFWPWVVKRSKNLFKFLVIFISIFIFFKFSLRVLGAKTSYQWPYAFIETMRFECMAIGALGAYLAFNNYAKIIKMLFHPVSQIVAWLCIVLVLINKFHILSVIDHDIIAVISVVIIINVSMNPRTIIRLDYYIFDFLGKISYGIYVYHPLAVYFAARILSKQLSQFPAFYQHVIIFSSVVIPTVFIAWLSYNFFEKRFLIKKEKFALVHSSS